MQNFEGDLLLVDTPDGGDILIDEGLFQADSSLETAVYLSLFGGNKEDSGKVKTNKTWWGNTLDETSDEEKLISRFQYIITALPLSVKNIRAAEAAAVLDLQWAINLGIADKIEAEGRIKDKGWFFLEIKILKNADAIFNGNFLTAWTAGAGGVYGV